MRGIIKKIDKIQFGLMSPEQIREMSVVKVLRPDTYDEDGYPIDAGLMDSRMGVIDPSLKCRTCGERGGECQGHFGMIELARPVIHVGFAEDIHKILRSTCSECGRILLDDEEIKEFTEKMQELQSNGENVDGLVNEIYKICKDKKQHNYFRKSSGICPHCGAEQNDIRLIRSTDVIEIRRQYDEEGNIITDDSGLPRTEDYDLTASEVRGKLQRIPDEDAYLLGVNPEVSRPEWMVLTVLPVPPVTTRPSITLDTGERSEDDLTHKLIDILRINQRLIENMEAGAPQLIVEDLWKLLQYHVTTYFNNDTDYIPPARHRSGRPLKTLTQRLEGKEGRFRSNLSGKYVNFSARTVISPDPNISINEVGVPEIIAKEVTIPTYVNKWNEDELKRNILNGPNIYPGANYVKKHINGKELKVRVMDNNCRIVVENLEYGDVVMRHLKDGDIVLFNHQPSLHRMSIMAHEVRVLPYGTFRLNPCVCPPYNVDFDGAEMNIHVLQTDESRAEAKSLMSVQKQILSPRFGGPIIGAIHDHISGAYLLTREGTDFPEDVAYQMIRNSHLLDNTNVDKKHLQRKNRNWTGKELFSLLLPDDLNMNYKAEICRDCENCLKEDCQYDAFVVIKDGQLTHGAIDGAAFGSFSGRILGAIVREYGSSCAKEFLDCSTKLAIDAISRMGFTTSTNDIEIPEEALEVIDAHLDMSEQEVDKLIATYEEGLLQPLPGRSAEETLEMRIMQILEESRDVAAEIAEGYLTMGKQSQDDAYDYVMAVENHALVSAKTGAGASMLNLAQETACVGQQSVRCGRITRGYQGRPLPHFRRNELGARAKGFVHSSYKQGLDPVEFFFHAMGGRDTLVETSFRTMPSFYMHRRLINALEDLNVRSDGLVTDKKGNIIQSVFGEEGIDPAKSDFGHVANLDQLIDEMRIKNNDSYKDDKDNHPSFEDEPDIKKPVKSKEDKLLESKTLGYRKSYRKTENMINSVIDDYDSVHEDYLELNNNLEKLEKKIKKLTLVNNPYAKDINAIHLNLVDIDRELSEAHNNLQKNKVKLASLKGKSYEFSSIDEVDTEITKLNSISYNIQLAEIDWIEMKLDEEISSFDSIKERCDSLFYVPNRKKELIRKIKSKINEINFEINENSYRAAEMNSLLKIIKGFDDDFTHDNSETIENLLGEISDISQNSKLFIESAKDLNSQLNSSIKSLESVKDIDDFKEKKLSIDALLNKDMPVDILKIRQDYEEQMVIYNDLKSQELEFKEKKTQEEKFKENYAELYEMGLTYNDVNDEILHIYSKFIEFTSEIGFKFKIISSELSDEDVDVINSNIISDIVNKEITETNFNIIYDEYIKEYREMDSLSFISDEEFKEKYKELYDLGFRFNDVNEEIIENCHRFNDYVISPQFYLKFMSLFLKEDEKDEINKNIITDIINKKLIGDLNFDSIYTNYSDNYKAEKRLKDIDWEDILKNMDLGLFDEETIEYSKKMVTTELKDGKLSKNHVKSRFKVHINKKREIDKKLKYLEELKDDPNNPDNKRYLSQSELESIYLLVESEISNENPEPVQIILKNEINILIKKNQSKARKSLERYYKDMDRFTEITGLYINDAEILISRIESEIGQNRIKAEDINENYIHEAAIKLRRDMDYVDKTY